MTTRVYAAEDEVFGPEAFSGGRWSIPWAEAVDLAERLVPGVEVVRRRSGACWRPEGWPHAGPDRSTWRGPGTIAMQLGTSRVVVLHECAHALTPTDPSHGAAFQAAYVDLVGDELGEWWARRLAAAFARHGTRGHAAARARVRSRSARRR